MSLPVNLPTGQAPPVPSGGGRAKMATEGEPADLGFALLLAALTGTVNPPGLGPAVPDQGAATLLDGAPAAAPATGGETPGGWRGALALGGLNPAVQTLQNPALQNPALQNLAAAQAEPGAGAGAAAQTGPSTPTTMEMPSPLEFAAPAPATGITEPADDAEPRLPQGTLQEMAGAEAPAAQSGTSPLTAASPGAQQGFTGSGNGGSDAAEGGPSGPGDLAGAGDPADSQPVRQEPAGAGQAAPAPTADRAELAPAGESPLPEALESLRAERHEPARLMEAIARSVRSSPEGEYTVTLRLHPEQLGELRLELRLSGRSVTALMEVSTPEARQALEARGDVLRQSLEGAGFTLSGFEVATGQQQQQSAWERWQALEAELTRMSLMGGRPAGSPPGPATGPVERVRSAGRHTGRLDTKA